MKHKFYYSFYIKDLFKTDKKNKKLNINYLLLALKNKKFLNFHKYLNFTHNIGLEII